MRGWRRSAAVAAVRSCGQKRAQSLARSRSRSRDRKRAKRAHTPANSGYVANVTWKVYTALTLTIAACAAIVGFVIVMGMLTSEYWCSDRWPWWGPPQDPNSDCTGHWWASNHPDDYPWTMPK